MNKLKRKNTILKRKQTFRNIKDIEAENLINDIEDKIEKKVRRTISRKPFSQSSILQIEVGNINEIKPSLNTEEEPIEEKTENTGYFIDFY